MANSTTTYAQLRALTAIGGGLSAFASIAWAHLETLGELLQQQAAGLPLTASIELTPKLITLVLSMLAVSAAITYIKSGRASMRLLARIGLYWAIAAVLLCFIDLRWIL